MNLFKILIRMQTGNWIDVSEREAVIYGAGQGCIDFMNEIHLPNVRYVVDSDENKWDKEIQLLNIVYKVQRPLILSSLNMSKYYIVISSNKYSRDIKKTIEKYVEIDNILVCDRENIFYCYERIEDMFYYDPIIKRKLLMSNLSFSMDKIISLFKNVSKFTNSYILNCFIPLKSGGSKLCFIFGNQTDLWVFSIPGLHNEIEKMGIDRDKKDNREIRYALKKRFIDDKVITVYEDTDVLIQKYAREYIDFQSDEVKNAILNKCRVFHEIQEKIEIQNDMISHHYSYWIDIVSKKRGGLVDTIKKIEESMRKPLKKLREIGYSPRICHCDLNYSNIICYNKELFIIDWEYLAMSDPMFDVCGFLFSIQIELCDKNGILYEDALQNVHTSLKQDLTTYFGRDCTEEEYTHAFLVMLIFECKEALKECISRGIADNAKTAALLQRIHYNKILI